MAKQKPPSNNNKDSRFRPWNQDNLHHNKPPKDLLKQINQLNQQLANAMDLLNAHFANKWDA
jgi:hypothetical protein